MIDIKEKKEKIISFLENFGPALPVRISAVIEMEPVFASAILSELYNDGKIKMSNMKIGSSRLYFLPGQEQKLENFSDSLKPLEKEALSKIKSEKILEDEKTEPAIRVALSNLKDFSSKFETSGKNFWKYNFTTEYEINQILNPPKKTQIEKTEKKDESGGVKENENGSKEKVKKMEMKPKKIEQKFEKIITSEETKSEFYDEVEKFLLQKEISIAEKIQVGKKEVMAKINLKTSVGNLNFLLVAKNKRSVGKDEINAIMQNVNYHKMPCLLILKKEIPKSVLNLSKENGLIKIESM